MSSYVTKWNSYGMKLPLTLGMAVKNRIEM